MIITLDGPAASGKSSAALGLAQRLGFYYINSGLLYRVVAYLMMHDYVLEDIQESFKENTLRYIFDGQKAAVFFENRDITSYLKTSEIDQEASIMSEQARVRNIVNAWQRELAQEHDIVIDGRDCGTEVFPDAHIKFFITATLEVRAKRWRTEQCERFAKNITQEEAESILQERDQRDSTRKLSPLRKPIDAITIDTSLFSLDQVIDQLFYYVRKNNL